MNGTRENIKDILNNPDKYKGETIVFDGYDFRDFRYKYSTDLWRLCAQSRKLPLIIEIINPQYLGKHFINFLPSASIKLTGSNDASN